ncbi:MAG: hypothetical protein QM500_09925 [Methylococcales bacterium]
MLKDLKKLPGNILISGPISFFTSCRASFTLLFLILPFAGFLFLDPGSNQISFKGYSIYRQIFMSFLALMVVTSLLMLLVKNTYQTVFFNAAFVPTVYSSLIVLFWLVFMIFVYLSELGIIYQQQGVEILLMSILASFSLITLNLTLYIKSQLKTKKNTTKYE